MRTAAQDLGDLLRAEGAFAPDATQPSGRRLVLMIVIGTGIYGLIMGSFSGRLEQCVYSAIKLPLFIGVATVVCLPQFFVISTILGLRDDFVDACRAILCAQATLAVTLASVAPLVGVVYFSTSDYRLALNYHGLPFLGATVAAQVTLSRHYRPLIARNARHRIARNLWLFLYIFVAIQGAWVLRPFVGAPTLETEFFREDAWSNAYVEIARGLALLFSRGS